MVGKEDWKKFFLFAFFLRWMTPTFGVWRHDFCFFLFFTGFGFEIFVSFFSEVVFNHKILLPERNNFGLRSFHCWCLAFPRSKRKLSFSGLRKEIFASCSSSTIFEILFGFLYLPLPLFLTLSILNPCWKSSTATLLPLFSPCIKSLHKRHKSNCELPLKCNRLAISCSRPLHFLLLLFSLNLIFSASQHSLNTPQNENAINTTNTLRQYQQ